MMILTITVCFLRDGNQEVKKAQSTHKVVKAFLFPDFLIKFSLLSLRLQEIVSMLYDNKQILISKIRVLKHS